MAFLYSLEPFGLSDVAASRKLHLIIGYAVTSFVILAFGLILIPRAIPSIFKEKDWILGKRILWQLWLVFTVGTGCFLFNATFHLLNDELSISFSRFLHFQLFASVVGVFPIVVFNLAMHIRWLNRNHRGSEKMPSQRRTQGPLSEPGPGGGARATLTSESGREKYELDPYDIAYAVSEGNYTGIFFANDATRKIFIRGSLNRIEKQLLAYPFLLRCHRAYIVNVTKVRDVTGNAQGLQLILENSERMIPVARSRVREFRSRMKTLRSN